jgi:hypothetical protein
MKEVYEKKKAEGFEGNALKVDFCKRRLFYTSSILWKGLRDDEKEPYVKVSIENRL